MINFTDRHERAVRLFADANVLPLTFQYYESVSNLMHDIIILKLFRKTSNTLSIHITLDHPPLETFTSKILD